MGSLLCSGNWTRTSDLRVMSPTSYLLLYPAMWTAKIQRKINFTKVSLKLLFQTVGFELYQLPFFKNRGHLYGITTHLTIFHIGLRGTGI